MLRILHVEVLFEGINEARRNFYLTSDANESVTDDEVSVAVLKEIAGGGWIVAQDPYSMQHFMLRFSSVVSARVLSVKEAVHD